MRIAGIIAEYNPFHNGHAWQIEQLRQKGFDAVVCVCSPGVVQRGEPAMLPTRVRTAAALAGGADLVISLPAPYAVLSSEGFAAAGVALLTALGCVDALCFGVEAAGAAEAGAGGAAFEAEENATESIMRLAAALEDPAFPPLLRKKLDTGLPLPAARAAAAEELCPGAGALLRQSNALLDVDYCRAILRQKSSLVPLALPRMGAAHDAPLAAGTAGILPPEYGDSVREKSLAPRFGDDVPQTENAAGAAAPQTQYASASALRALAGREGAAALSSYVPAACRAIYRQAEAEGAWLDEAAFSAAALSRLRMLSAQQLRGVRGAAEGLEYRLAAAIQGAGTWDALIDAMKTKRYPTARLRRFALDAVLGYTGALRNTSASGDTAAPSNTVSLRHTAAPGNTAASRDIAAQSRTGESGRMPTPGCKPTSGCAPVPGSFLPTLPPYLHVLGANEAGRAVLRAAKETARLPLSHSLALLAKAGPQAAAVAAAHAAAEDFTALCLRRPAPMGTAYTAKAQFVP